MLIQEQYITLPARADAPETKIFTKTLVKERLGARNVILLIPGGPGGNHTIYDAMVNHLFPYADLLLVDLRGCGYSQKAQVTDCVMNKHIDDMDAIRQCFGLETIILFGASYGSMASLGYAIRYPAQLKKLMLLAGAPSYYFLAQALAELEKIGTEEQKYWGKKLFEGRLEAGDDVPYFEAMAPLYSIFLKNNQGYQLPTLAKRIPYNVELLNYSFSHNFYQFDYRNGLDKISCPTLVLGGMQDWINAPEGLQIIAEGIPNAELKLLDQCSHYVWLDQPKLFNKTIAAFLSK